jgi:uncharacterized protein (DUF427 family)
MAKATWNGVEIAQSDATILLEGNHYFPPDSVHHELLRASETHTLCPWKGVASYWHVEVEGQTNSDAAWSYPDPKPAAREIAGFIAFWHGVRVEP